MKMNIYLLASVFVLLPIQASQLKVDVQLERSASYSALMLSPSGKPSEQSDLRSASAMPSASAQSANGGNQLGFSLEDEIARWNKVKSLEGKIQSDVNAATGYLRANPWIFRKQIESHAPLLSDSQYDALTRIALEKASEHVKKIAISTNLSDVYPNQHIINDLMIRLRDSDGRHNCALLQHEAEIVKSAAVLNDDTKKLAEKYVQMDQAAQKWFDMFADPKVDLNGDYFHNFYFGGCHKRLAKEMDEEGIAILNSSTDYFNWRYHWERDNREKICDAFTRRQAARLEAKKLKKSSCVIQ